MNETFHSCLLDHYEKHLGTLTTRWRLDKMGLAGVSVFKCSHQPNEDCHTYVTAGLSEESVHLEGEDGPFHFEFLICVPLHYEPTHMIALLYSVVSRALELNLVDFHGVIKGEGPVRIGGNPKFQHFYLTHPGHFPEGADVCAIRASEIRIVQLIPITSAESDFIQTEGWEAFEDSFSSQGTDLMAFDDRSELGLPRSQQ